MMPRMRFKTLSFAVWSQMNNDVYILGQGKGGGRETNVSGTEDTVAVINKLSNAILCVYNGRHHSQS